MVDLSNVTIGDRVKIVDEWTKEDLSYRVNPEGGMDHWRGQILTVREVWDDRCLMVEDKDEWKGNGWSWFPELLDMVVEDFVIRFDEDEFMSMI